MSDRDEFWMHRALAEAESGRGRVEPNPLVGAVLVRDGRFVSAGFHARFGGPHAEVEAVVRAGDEARGATLYVTLEPCCHTGKTPPCTDAVLNAGVARVVAAMRDPFPKVAGGGIARLRSAGLVVDVGVEEASARRLNAPYLKRLATGRPYVIAKWAMTLDGRTAARSGQSAWISGPRSRALVHETRGRVDAIVIGIGTALADDPLLTARPAGPRTAARVVLDPEARLPPDGRLVRSASAAPVVVVVNDRAPVDRAGELRRLGCEVVALRGSERIDVREVLERLGDRGATNVLVEGGGLVLGAFLDAGQVDAVDVFLAPILEGGSHAFSPVRGSGVDRVCDGLRLEHHEVSVVDGDVRVTGTLPESWATRESS